MTPRHSHTVRVRIPGRDFDLHLTRTAAAPETYHIEVTDTRAERLPAPAPAPDGHPDAESAGGLLLVSALADTWGCTPRPRAPARPSQPSSRG
ncbi:ATP-binding protein [Streptomyces sp. NPDC001401]|uniref:ATP-binding protein n=1 Tax=Streptomyces sp. NPDC001401 TaxID=3364570 RepID=UPI0036D166A6